METPVDRQPNEKRQAIFTGPTISTRQALRWKEPETNMCLDITVLHHICAEYMWKINPSLWRDIAHGPTAYHFMMSQIHRKWRKPVQCCWCEWNTSAHSPDTPYHHFTQERGDTAPSILHLKFKNCYLLNNFNGESASNNAKKQYKKKNLKWAFARSFWYVVLSLSIFWTYTPITFFLLSRSEKCLLPGIFLARNSVYPSLLYTTRPHQAHARYPEKYCVWCTRSLKQVQGLDWWRFSW